MTEPWPGNGQLTRVPINIEAERVVTSRGVRAIYG